MSDINSKPDMGLLFQLAAGQRGYFTAAQAHTYRFSDALLSYHTQRGHFERERRRLYRFPNFPSYPQDDVFAAWLAAGREAVVSHETALDIYALSDVIPERIHLTVPRARRSLRLPGVALHTVYPAIPPQEIMLRLGMRITAPGRTILDVAMTSLSPEHVARAIEDATKRGLIIPDQLRTDAMRRGERMHRIIREALEREGG